VERERIGSISDYTAPWASIEEEKRVLVTVIKDLLGLIEQTPGQGQQGRGDSGQ
jgi:hypothetical protein